MDRIRIGVIGLGTMGSQYAKIYSAHPLAEVVAVSALQQDQVDKVRSLYGVPHGYTDYRKMLERQDLDAVVVATPDSQHYEPTRAVLESGRHALVEKPFTTSTAEADELIRISRQAGKIIQVAFNHRWLSAYHQAKATIAGGEIGMPLAGYARKNDTIFVSTQHLSWAGTTTPAWFLSSHDIDLMRWWLASEPVEARAWGRKEVLVAMGIPHTTSSRRKSNLLRGPSLLSNPHGSIPTLFLPLSNPSWKSSGAPGISTWIVSANLSR